MSRSFNSGAPGARTLRTTTGPMLNQASVSAFTHRSGCSCPRRNSGTRARRKRNSIGTNTSCSGTARPLPTSNSTADASTYSATRAIRRSGVVDRSPHGPTTATRVAATRNAAPRPPSTKRSLAVIRRGRRSRARRTSPSARSIRCRWYSPLGPLSPARGRSGRIFRDPGNKPAMNLVDTRGPIEARYDEVLTDDALELVGSLHDQLDGTRRELLRARDQRQAELDEGGTLQFVPAPEDFTVAPVPPALQDRRVEITGPTSRKMVINALNSGARGFMADFEDANSPTWANMVGGQANLIDAVRGTIEHEEDGKRYRLEDQTATLLVRPRGWHLVERHVLVDGEPVAGGLFDFGVFLFHNAHELLERGAGPFFYLPKLESHLEARLWNDAFELAQDALGLERGTIKATVLIETLPAAFEMDEILHELRDHSAGLNAGRWDYIFSSIKRLRSRPEYILPDRSAVTMTVPFMRAYTELLVKTCHRRGAHAMGGMAAVIPSRTDQEANERAYAAVREDKQREAGAGFDGTWVAHPDSVPVATEAFD